ncbi:MAG: carboxypeptidase-like regulatory domain-containing protein [Arachidicoccus sp.]|nr:carboxypeptidase-like regulatory domain-containing protein [Arachidicoccus sp.]
MKKIILILIFIVSSFISFSQTIIQGWVKDNKMKPVRNASISIKNSYDGGITDSLGNYKFTTTEKGNDTLIITCTGYEDYQKVIIISGETITANIVLNVKFNELTAVTVTAGAFSAGDKQRGVVMKALDVVTTATNGDISTAFRTLPGVQQIGEQEGLFVRGGDGTETKQFIDGAVIPNPYFKGPPQIAQRGRFNPFLFSGMLFSTGGYSALYGNALSSVLLMNTTDFPEKSEVDLNVSPLFLGGSMQHLAKDKKSSYGFNYSYTDVSLYFDVVKTKPDFFSAPKYHTADFNFRMKTKWGGMIKYYSSFGFNRVGMRQQDYDSLNTKDQFDVKSTNWYNNIYWTENLGHRWKMYWSNSFAINNDNVKAQLVSASNQPIIYSNNIFWMNLKTFHYVNTSDYLQSHLVFEKKFSHLNAVRFGTEYNYQHSNMHYQNIYSDIPLNLNDNYAALFAESDIYFTEQFTLQVGGRAERSALLNKNNIVPRAALAYKLGNDGQMSAAYGIFYQKPDDMYLLYNQNMDYLKATHYILNYQKGNFNRMIRVEAYYKKYDNLIKTVSKPEGQFTYNNNGYGYAKGIDMFWKDTKTIKNFGYRISYSYIDTKREYLTYPEQLHPSFTTPHNFSAVLNTFILPLKTQVNLTYSFATGRPYYNFYPNNQGGYNITDRGTTMDYNNLSLSVDYLPNLGKPKSKCSIVIVASANNILGLKQIYGYNYSYDGSYKTPILPSARQFFFLGVFFSWGVDRSQQTINDNM